MPQRLKFPDRMSPGGSEIGLIQHVAQVLERSIENNNIKIRSMNMALEEMTSNSKRAYSKIPVKKRMALVKLVLKKGMPLNDVISQLNIKVTTARFILNKFKETGTFPRRKFKRKNTYIPPKQKSLLPPNPQQEKEPTTEQMVKIETTADEGRYIVNQQTINHSNYCPFEPWFRW